MKTIERIQAWYLAQCNGLWEHQWGIKIDTLDNPGWSVVVDLDDTPSANQHFATEDMQISETDWLHCWKKGTKFHGRGGPGNLGAILECFLRFVGG
jgi:hypothetical protein